LTAPSAVPRLVLPADRMPEAEVAIRFALHLLRKGRAVGDVTVAIDGAQIRTENVVHFPIADFLAVERCTRSEASSWQGDYSVDGAKGRLRIHSRTGEADVIATLSSGHVLRAECKKGPLSATKGAPERVRLQLAIGQLMTSSELDPNIVLAVVVPHSDTFNRLATEWRSAPLIEQAGIHIVTVDRNDAVHGLPQMSDLPTPPTSRRTKRTDATGRAYAGSQCSIQRWVNERGLELSSAMVSALGSNTAADSIQWVSPLKQARFREFRDGAFLGAIGQAHMRERLAAFWPSRGPVWDAVAITRQTGSDSGRVFLIEAKSYPAEVYGSGCMAKPDGDSFKRIAAALDKTAAWLDVPRLDSWTGRLYQSANRIAHVYFLREELNLDAYLVNVCFVDDPIAPTSTTAWESAIRSFRKDLGIESLATPWMADVMLPAMSTARLSDSPERIVSSQESDRASPKWPGKS
jgi:hypothetical protein